LKNQNHRAWQSNYDQIKKTSSLFKGMVSSGNVQTKIGRKVVTPPENVEIKPNQIPYSVT
jgi:hypothetical protein